MQRSSARGGRVTFALGFEARLSKREAGLEYSIPGWWWGCPSGRDTAKEGGRERPIIYYPRARVNGAVRITRATEASLHRRRWRRSRRERERERRRERCADDFLSRARLRATRSGLRCQRSAPPGLRGTKATRRCCHSTSAVLRDSVLPSAPPVPVPRQGQCPY
jgi:hypothetical protein